jgi:mannose-6-phosphate isomerase-like protein (cupin superfamily)
MPEAAYRVVHVSEIAPSGEDEHTIAGWRPVRIHFGIKSFGIGAYVADAAGETLTNEHTEVDTCHEELFFVASGRASFRIGEETVEAPSGTFVYVPDPAVVRGATALEPGTTLLAVGGEPGKAFEVSSWERKYVDGE